MRASTRRGWRGQSAIEVALCLPMVCTLLLGAVDYARVLSAQHNLAHAAHVITLRLIKTPAPRLGAAGLTTLVAGESGLAGATATVRYVADSTGNVQAIVSASYAYSLLLPGLQKLRLRGAAAGTLPIMVQAAGVATTSAPSLAPSGATPPGLIVTLPPLSTDGSAPSAATLTCAIYASSGAQVARGACSSGSYTWAPASPSPGTYTARLIQPNSITSPSSTAVTI